MTLDRIRRECMSVQYSLITKRLIKLQDMWTSMYDTSSGRCWSSGTPDRIDSWSHRHKSEFRSFYKWVCKNGLYEKCGSFKNLSLSSRQFNKKSLRRTLWLHRKVPSLPELNPYTPSGRFLKKDSARYKYEEFKWKNFYKKHWDHIHLKLKLIQQQREMLEALMFQIENVTDEYWRASQREISKNNKRIKAAQQVSGSPFFKLNALTSLIRNQKHYETEQHYSEQDRSIQIVNQ